MSRTKRSVIPGHAAGQLIRESLRLEIGEPL
jgi:hypothetical protein